MEYLDFCISTERACCFPLTVDAIYYVFADRHYNIRHQPIPESLVFVSTLSGEGILNLQKKSYRLLPGDFLIFDAAQAPFDYRCPKIGWNFWWFEFRALQPDFIELERGKVYTTPLDDFQLSLCNKALSRLKLKDAKTTSAFFTSLICLLQKISPEGKATLKGIDLFSRADAYIRRHLATATVKSIALNMGISERTLLTLFQNLLGLRTTVYIHNLKTDMARHLLLCSQSEIKEIAEQLGYSDQFSFCKSFRKRFNLSPTQYRMKYRGKGEQQD